MKSIGAAQPPTLSEEIQIFKDRFRFSINYTAKFSFRLNFRSIFQETFFKRGLFPPLSINYTHIFANRLLFIRTFFQLMRFRT